MKIFLETFYQMFIDMGFYLMLGISFVGVLHIFMKREWITQYLGGNSLWESIKACLFGVPLPLCSCSVIPTGIYLYDQGASLSATTAFLISTPQTGIDAIIATYGLMGLTLAWFRPIAAFFSGIIGGGFVGLFTKNDNIKHKQKYSNNDCCSYEHHHEYLNNNCSCDCENEHLRIPENASILTKIKGALHYSFIKTISDISIHFLIGLLIATLISVLIPADLLVHWGINSGILAMLIMIVVGAPMYICSTASIPIALTLMTKGLSPGTAFVFLFMGPFTNAVSLSILVKKLGKKVVTIYVTTAALSAIGFGFLLDWLISKFNLPIITELCVTTANSSFGIFKIIVAAIFFILLAYNLSVKILNRKSKLHNHKLSSLI